MLESPHINHYVAQSTANTQSPSLPPKILYEVQEGGTVRRPVREPGGATEGLGRRWGFHGSWTVATSSKMDAYGP
jgi:hypothetical protein